MSTLWTRRQLLGVAGAAASLSAVPALAATAKPARMRKPLPGGETIPVIGMGTWQTFNVGRDLESARRAHGGAPRLFRARSRAAIGPISCSATSSATRP